MAGRTAGGSNTQARARRMKADLLRRHCGKHIDWHLGLTPQRARTRIHATGLPPLRLWVSTNGPLCSAILIVGSSSFQLLWIAL